MNWYQRIATYGLLIGSALLGCSKEKPTDSTPPEAKYFAAVPASSTTGVSITSGDFDKDGNLDIIVSAIAPSGTIDSDARLYFFKGDGKGGFKFEKRVFEPETK